MGDDDLLSFILGVVERLMLTVDYDGERLRQVVEASRSELAEMAGGYEGEVPPGAEAVRELMLESLHLYDSALAHILAFLDDEDEERLRVAVAEAEEASDVLGLVDSLIQTSKDLLSEMTSA
jgi:hypothetical protein